ncbi:MAG: glucose-1-phosphate thymidylyltransferase [Candidatus Vecturithrix sp.]|jgi:NDP-sugar pyrophosphorylase family protein|nr:glucose-1-phosphate thymidylyltransferase [Candidatus Vecturithrix sp.]
MLKPENFFAVHDFSHRAIFEDLDYVWDALKRLSDYLQEVIVPSIEGNIMNGAYLMDDQIQIGEGSVIEPGAYIAGPTIIGKNTVVRHGAYIRGNVLIGDECVVGHTSELKGAILLNHCGAPHFNYVGDSILGNYVNLGAGTKLSNVKMLKGSVKVRIGDVVYDSKLRKFGAILGDRAETGCNSVLNPGTLIGPNSLVYPNASVSGYVPPNSIVKLRQTLELAMRESRV